MAIGPSLTERALVDVGNDVVRDLSAVLLPRLAVLGAALVLVPHFPVNKEDGKVHRVEVRDGSAEGCKGEGERRDGGGEKGQGEAKSYEGDGEARAMIPIDGLRSGQGAPILLTAG